MGKITDRKRGLSYICVKSAVGLVPAWLGALCNFHAVAFSCIATPRGCVSEGSWLIH